VSAPHAGTPGAAQVDAGGVSLFVETEGAGPPVVLLHGFTGSGRSLAETAASLRPGFRTVRIDLVGHGRSDAPADSAAYTLEACAAQVARVIEVACSGSAHVLGYSMGGRVALALAAWHPTRVRSTILIGARAGLADAAVRAERRRADEALARDLERDGLEAFVDRWMALPLFASQARLGPAFLARARRERLRQDPAGLAASLRGMGAGAQPPLFDRLGEIDVPALLVAGAEDERFAEVADDLARRLPRARAVRIAGAGHAAHLERPEAFARVAREFLHGLEPRVPRPAPERIEGIEPEREETCRT
jgi:2-succinyl-6-hydroxy-2,4-cyclohexadiene-1-carboxylate synthase